MRVAIDTGGTFTDCIFVRDGRLQVLKVPSTPASPAQAIGQALRSIVEARKSAPPGGGRSQALELICGTTVGTNALLQRRGGRVTLVTTKGFEDVLELGRQARPRLYDFFVTRPEPLAPRTRRLGLRERVGADGRTLLSPGQREIARMVRKVTSTNPDAVAICLLFSFASPHHERALARALRARGFAVSVSHEVLPEFREFERTATTVVNAYLLPVMGRYLLDTQAVAVRSAPGRRPRVRVMQSSGGIVSSSLAAREPVRTILSGPAGGVLGAQFVAERSGFARVISFDMGGTSTDVALLEGGLRTTNESEVAGLPVAVPVLDIHTVGAGGGSLARFDGAGALRVGPESAGADPGPICYGRGTQPTVTDAHVLLGRLGAEGLLGGSFVLHTARTREWMARALRTAPSRTLRLEQFAQGIVDVANATMEKAIRVISIERGYDPREYTLVAFGGAGGLHGCDLAAALGMPRVLVPKHPGALSALGILRSDVVRDFSRTVCRAGRSLPEFRRLLEPSFRALERRGLRELRAEGFPALRVGRERLVDARYLGQSYELTIPAAGDFLSAFHWLHQRRFGYCDRTRTVEVVNVRARLTGRTPKPELPQARPAGPSPHRARVGRRSVWFSGHPRLAEVYDRARLRAGNRLRGPALVAEYSATTVLPPGWSLRVDARENLTLERA